MKKEIVPVAKKEILLVADAVSNEKGVDRNIIFEAIELALATAAKKRFDEDSTITVTIDRRTGGFGALGRGERRN
ncbi:MAG TPA: NusA N-terminal domain-containing protein, partial [Cellvibrionaceae bacterium]|nr:NusA N-terminal domain-containing protein [Cellvibrionaceae bacterium]